MTCKFTPHCPLPLTQPPFMLFLCPCHTWTISFTALKAPELEIIASRQRMATISITIPDYEFTIPISFFVLSLSRTINSSYEVCTDLFDDRVLRRDKGSSFTANYMNLEENSTYAATVTATFNPPGEGLNKSATLEFVTPTARKT